MSVNQNKSYKAQSGKVTICGPYIEILFFTKFGRIKKKNKNPTKEQPNNQSLLLSRRKTIRNMTNLINCNIGQWHKNNGKPFPPIFLTLTFKDPITDLKIANRLFSEFIQNYNYRIFKEKKKKLQYLAVPEFQKNGRVHYHCLVFNLPFSNKNYDIARDVWGQGFIFMKAAYRNNSYTLAKYMSKYLIKACDDPRLFRKRKYFPSSKILRPIELKGYFTASDIFDALKNNKINMRNRVIPTEFIGDIDAHYAVLAPHEDILDILPDLDPYTRNKLQFEINKQQQKQNL